MGRHSLVRAPSHQSCVSAPRPRIAAVCRSGSRLRSTPARSSRLMHRPRCRWRSSIRGSRVEPRFRHTLARKCWRPNSALPQRDKGRDLFDLAPAVNVFEEPRRRPYPRNVRAQSRPCRPSRLAGTGPAAHFLQAGASKHCSRRLPIAACRSGGSVDSGVVSQCVHYPCRSPARQALEKDARHEAETWNFVVSESRWSWLQERVLPSRRGIDRLAECRISDSRASKSA